MTEQEIINILKEVRHPGKGDRSVVELGMVDKIEADTGKVAVTLAFVGRKDPLADYLGGAVRAALIRNLPKDTEINVKTIVKEEAPHKKQLELDDEGLANVRHIIGIASGKGGVGKSTVAVNLAVALARMGYKVGLADADVYGPSIPLMTGTQEVTPEVVETRTEGEEPRQWFVPIEKYGVKWMSIGYFAQPEQALIWRGPMASGALKQMVLQVKWDDLDYLLIDMPPGTGDIHISLVRDIPMEGAIIVTTPQQVALSDVLKGVNMFKAQGIEKPVYGLIENMAWFTPEELPDNKYYIFGKEGGVRMAKELGLELLGQIPLVQGIRESGDSGEPSALGSSPDGVAFIALAGRIAEILP
ncbi:MAG: Mrp/NBP35 family ATP-binding protein [Bacteroidales bacterium]|nr:Mrp/NBP35 family ATP-binding protein [Bacteroidales bacterium]